MAGWIIHIGYDVVALPVDRHERIDRCLAGELGIGHGLGRGGRLLRHTDAEVAFSRRIIHPIRLRLERRNAGEQRSNYTRPLPSTHHPLPPVPNTRDTSQMSGMST